MNETRISISSGTAGNTTFWEIVEKLAASQKNATVSAPAYSVFVNRKLGRLLAAWAYRAGLTPNAVTGVSAAFTFSGIVLLMVFPPSAWLGITVSLLLVIGYAFDSADGQVARLRGGGSLSGEWLDHVVDATKLSLLPLSLAVGLFRFQAVDTAWLLVPLGSAVVSAVLFFGMILTEQLRRQLGVKPSAPARGARSRLRSVLFLPMDYGVLCLSFLLLGSPTAFTIAYTLIFAGTTVFLIAALPKWYRDLARAGKQEH